MKRMNKVLAVLTAAVILPVTAQAATAERLQELAGKTSPAIVTVKFNLAVNLGRMSGNTEQESPSEVTCVMIDPAGVAVCSNNQINGNIDLIRKMAPAQAGTMSATPRDVQVIIDTHDAPYDADIIVRDSELDLAWVRIREPGDRPHDFIDFSAGMAATVGEEVFFVRRTGSGFGRIPVISAIRIGGSTSAPRDLYLPGSPINNGAGLPVVNSSGNAVGLVVTLYPDLSSGAQPMSMMGAGNAGLVEAMSGLILPAAAVAKATQRALAED